MNGPIDKTAKKWRISKNRRGGYFRGRLMISREECPDLDLHAFLFL